MKKVAALFFSLYGIMANAASPISDVKLKVWANTAIISVYNYDYQNIMTEQKKAAKYFSIHGWQAYMKAFLSSGLKEDIDANKYTVSSVTMRPPKILKQGPEGQGYGWKISMPIVVLFENTSQQQVQYLNINIHVLYKNNKLAITQYYSQVAAVPGCPISKKLATDYKEKMEKESAATTTSATPPPPTNKTKPST